MPTVSRHDIDVFLGPLEGLAPEEEAEVLQNVDPNNEQQVRAVIRRHCSPVMAGMRHDVRERYKNTLRYFLTTRQADFQAIIDGMQDMPLRNPDEPVNLFLWTWKELFPGEDYHIDDLTGWMVDDEWVCAPIKRWWEFWKQ